MKTAINTPDDFSSLRSLSQLHDFCLAHATPLLSGQQGRKKMIQNRLNSLTKPVGSLGRLEDVVIWLGLIQRQDMPQINQCHTLVFAGNHGITAQNISAYPMQVTQDMVRNFYDRGAAINQITEQAHSSLEIICLNNLHPTRDFSHEPAMTEQEFLHAVITGYTSVSPHIDLLCLGEMGIGNTTTAAALCCALLGGSAEEWAGAGAGLSPHGQSHKAKVIEAALKNYTPTSYIPLNYACSVGGFELAALLGATLAARIYGIAVVIDGFVCTSALAPLWCIAPSLLDHCILGHLSAEKAHTKLATQLSLTPLLSLGMRLGEGSGAALCISLIKTALCCYTGMKTFQEAHISSP